MQRTVARNRWITSLLGVSGIACGVMLAVSCKREERGFRVDAPSAQAATDVAVTDLYAGGASTAASQMAPNGYEENAYAISQGQRLYEGFNCVGCHAHGGGDKGPALMDDKWIYGSSAEQIHSTIIQGRPNGMPSFREKIPDYQVWQIVAYVRSMSGLTNPNAAPARSDHMWYKQPENSEPATLPRSTGIPTNAEIPQ
jgi:cytochrome c oxidase cbb3-type subunit 3